jgi:hypothetical protein
MPYRPSGVAPQAARASTSEELQEESGRLQRKSEGDVMGLLLSSSGCGSEYKIAHARVIRFEPAHPLQPQVTR